MRVLLAAKYTPNGPRPIGGVQSWVGTVAAEFSRLGHDAVMWSPGLPEPAGSFDFGILANHGDTGRAAAWCDRSVWISHGIIPAERPPEVCTVAFTSEGVRDHWGMQGPVIRQPIDLAFWSPDKAAASGLVRYSYRGGLDWLPQVASRLGMTYTHLRDVTHAQAREVLRGAACVLATGRAALEAAACGAPLVICDHRSAYQGALLDGSPPEETMRRNYSGRGGCAPDPRTVTAAIKLAMGSDVWRSHVVKHHDASKIAEGLLYNG